MQSVSKLGLIADTLVTVVMAVVLGRLLPSEGERPRMSYGGLLVTAAKLLATACSVSL